MIFKTIKSQEKVDFTKNLAVMLKSGIAIDEALSSLAEQTKSKTFAKIIRTIQGEVETGTALSTAFSKEKKAFGTVFVSLLKVGESSGTLEENLSFLADWLERDNDLRQEIKAATLYPKFIFGATILLGGGLSVYILPNLIPLFDQLRVELPLATKLLLAFSLFVSRYWFFVLVSIALFIVGFIFINRLKAVRRVFHRLYIVAPFVKSLVISYQLALVSQLFFTLFKSGLDITKALDITSEAATNVHYQESIVRMKKRVGKGTTLSESLSAFPKLYPRSVVNIISTGEKSGTLDSSFGYLSEFYSKEVRIKTKKLPTTIEPALLVFIALMVGFVALAIISPIYEISRGLST
jgi:type II secretory pathway component PulF